MHRSLLAGLALLLLAAPAAAVAGNQAMVLVTDAGGITDRSLRTARLLFQAELRGAGMVVVEPPGMEQVQPIGEPVRSAAAGAGADVIYALSFSPLGKKLYVGVMELDADLTFRSERHLQARDVEELDLVLPRLVRSLASGLPVEQTEQVDTVTAQEGRRWEKEPGESFWGLGILGGLESSGPVGGDLRFVFEMERFRLNAGLGWLSSSGDDYLDLFRYSAGASYLFGKGSMSPYAGVDLAHLTISTNRGEGTGLGLSPHVGLEFFRFHRARMLLEAGVMLPFFSITSHSVSPHTDHYRAIGYASLAVVW